MANRSVRIFIGDMLGRIAVVEHVLAGKTFKDYRDDEIAKMVTERCLEIISEASRQIPENLKGIHPHIDWRGVRDVGNRLRHGYFVLEDRLIWTIATRSLAELKPVLVDMLQNLPPDSEA